MNDDYVPYPETIVIDANTIISATLTPGITREMLLTTEDDLYSPAFIHEEIATHRSVLRDKSGLADTALDTLLDTLFTTIEILPEDRTNQYREQAEQAMETIDPKDALYVAAALALNAAIWSGDLISMTSRSRRRSQPRRWSPASARHNERPKASVPKTSDSLAASIIVSGVRGRSNPFRDSMCLPSARGRY
jgi:predicted nucleic acid-binding protein